MNALEKYLRKLENIGLRDHLRILDMEESVLIEFHMLKFAKEQVKSLTIPIVIKSEATVYCDCEIPKHDCGYCSICNKPKRY